MSKRPSKPNRLDVAIRAAWKRDGRTAYALARDAGVWVASVQLWAAGGDLKLSTAAALCETLGLELKLKTEAK